MLVDDKKNIKYGIAMFIQKFLKASPLFKAVYSWIFLGLIVVLALFMVVLDGSLCSSCGIVLMHQRVGALLASLFWFSLTSKGIKRLVEAEKKQNNSFLGGLFLIIVAPILVFYLFLYITTPIDDYDDDYYALYKQERVIGKV